ncbi:MAG TPA: phosphoribosylanthranilate isomerase, partial [Candidatus Sulfotelmatobacter sp.]|nr:phosphoribosylanthranilate isomerase [Candidatus Sulfotelmatobacter sp.]
MKICGICDAGAAALAADAGADLLGFHFCSSRRRVTPEDARAIVDGLDVRPTIVGVFIDQDPDE